MNIPEMSFEEFAHPDRIDLRGIQFIPTAMSFWDDPDLNFHEMRLLSYIDFKQNRRTQTGCFVSDENLAMIMRASVKTVKNMIASLIKRGYLERKFNGYRFLFVVYKNQ